MLTLLVFACGTDKDKKAEELIRKSMETHGGKDAWEALQAFSMEKETWLFLEDGSLESHSIQRQEFRLRPYFEAKMSWEKDSISHKVHFDGLKTRYWMGENEIQNEGFLQSKKRDLDGAYYVMPKPFDLLEGGKILAYQGSQKLPDGRAAEVVQVIDGDPEDPATDIWWYYFDGNTGEILAYKAKTPGHYALVYNKSWDKSTGVFFPSERETYRVDSLGNPLYLRAKYAYRNYQAIK